MPEVDRFLLADAGLDLSPALFIRAEAGPVCEAVGPDALLCEQSFKPEFDRLMQSGFRATTKAKGEFALVLVNATRSRSETLGNIARGWAMLASGGTMQVNADKTEGADSLLRQLRAALPVNASLSKAHGRLIGLKKTGEPAPDWADALRLTANAAGFLTAPGMFSAAAADKGSVLLQAAFGSSLKGRVADLGAGWGYLSARALAQSAAISEIHLFEAESLALDASRLNVTDPRAQFHWADVAALTGNDGPFDAVICNPPFHASRAAEPQIGIAFIKAAARILSGHGTAWFVTNQQLPYEATLNVAFHKVTRVGLESGFKLFRCERPMVNRRG